MGQRRTPGGAGPGGRPRRRPGGTARSTPGAGTPRGVARGPERTDPARSGNRPAQARRPGAGGGTKRTRAPRPGRFTGRAAILALVLAALALAYAYPMRIYLEQRAEITALTASQQAQQKRIDEKAALRRQWDDPAFITTQAKLRLGWVLPGEKVYWVVDTRDGAAPAGTDAKKPKPADPWYGKLWSSINTADKK